MEDGSKLVHAPVMLTEVLAALAPHDGGIYVDGTFGRGGYSRGILEAADCQVWGIDRDLEAVVAGQELMQSWPGKFHMLKGRFSEMIELLAQRDITQVDGIALDLGVSSPQLEQAERGFSFRIDGPLDMRMGDAGATAADIVNSIDEAELTRIIWEYGEERFSRRIAKAIVQARKVQPITRTVQLAEIVCSCVPAAGKIHPATRTFQALRLYVNEELQELEAGLQASEALLAQNGRLAVVAFHSLEDRRVKTFLKEKSAKSGGGYRHLPPPQQLPEPTFKLLWARAKRPTDAEIAANPRARSARLRAAMRINNKIGWES
ncbi:MAG: 16S rRNA (cytosine(1402)-N(4))-methyltransferase RsmH [Pseudomonadota bacterium]